jgi:hypothetical protein
MMVVLVECVFSLTCVPIPARQAGPKPPRTDSERATTMSDPATDAALNQHADAAARELGQMVLKRELTADEFIAMSAIFKAAVQALQHGFIRRLAEHVQTERETESVEEFFENINPL